MSKIKLLKFDYRFLVVIILLITAAVATIFINLNVTDNSATKITGAIDVDNGDEEINWNRYQTTNVELSNSYEITKSGIYHFTGKINDGLISIKVSKDEPVKIILDNISIINSDGPAIACYEADDLIIELIGDNTLIDGETYSSKYDNDVRGTIYSAGDLTFEGDGSINLISNFEDGIISKDDLKIVSGTYYISSKDDGIRGKDSIYIKNGSFYIKSGTDAIKSNNETNMRKGFVLIENGNFKIESTGAKGIKAINSVLINDGFFEIETYDDSIHSNNYIGIKNGNITINSSDDAIHADRELIIDNGKIDIKKSYEGLEAQKITINDGSISIYALDDGINAGGGADNSSTNRPGANPFNVDENCVLSINGGDINIDASGDGIDSNGYLYFNGGKTIVDGPTNDGNGALDAGSEIIMTDGEVIAIGSSGMAENLGEVSSVHNISVYFETIEQAQTLIEIKDSKDETILSHISLKPFGHLSAGTNKFIIGETYTIYLNKEKFTDFTISSITTTIGNSNQEVMRPNSRKP